MGLALGDGATGVVVPLRVAAWPGVPGAAGLITSEARSRGVEHVVVGLPTRADGSDSDAAARSRALAAQLEAHGLTVALHPEYLTTVEARRRARSAGLPASSPVDHIAAQIVVEDYLSSRPGAAR